MAWFSTPLRALVIALTVSAAACGAGAQTADAPNVAAASDLQFALSEIAERFRRDTAAEVRLTFGSSGNFTRQIAQGAPFQMFLSADEGFIYTLADNGHTIGRGVLYAVGRLVLFAPSGSPLRVDATMTGLRAALAEGRIRRFAIANPEHAPYGRAAEQVLRGQGLWDSVRPLLVLGENVSQAAQFATSGAAQGGIFAYSLVLAPNISGRGAYVLLPAEWHAELAQRMVLLKGAGPTAQAFYRYLQEPGARDVFRRFGFTLPHES
jgi:molybdate transport system substrate-binding protein